MSSNKEQGDQVETLLETPNLADALESERFKQFLDHVPFAVAVSELHPSERLTYANLEFERLTGTSAAEVQGRPWNSLPIKAASTDDGSDLGSAVLEREDYLGTFSVGTDEVQVIVDAWSSTIQDESELRCFASWPLPCRTLVRLARRNSPSKSRSATSSCASCSIV